MEAVRLTEKLPFSRDFAQKKWPLTGQLKLWREASTIRRMMEDTFEEVLRSVFTFNGFDEPVEIRAPVVEDDTSQGGK